MVSLPHAAVYPAPASREGHRRIHKHTQVDDTQRPLDYYNTLMLDHILERLKVKEVRTSTKIHLDHKNDNS